MTEEPKDVKVFTKFNIVLFLLIPILSYTFSKHIVPFIWGDFSLGDYASLYTYSTLVQAFAALFALVGMFVIFKIQSIDNRMSAVEHQIIECLKGAVGAILTYGNVHKLRDMAMNPPSYLDTKRQKILLELSKDESWNNNFAELKELESRKFKIKLKFLKPLSLTILVIILGIGLLPFSQNLHSTPSRELICILNIVMFAIWGFIEMAVYVISTLRA
jgi:hypothetical protein